MIRALELFATQEPMTGPGSREKLLDAMPGDNLSLVNVVQGMMIHIRSAEHLGVTFTDATRRKSPCGRPL
jgi:hypothetical protein